MGRTGIAVLAAALTPVGGACLGEVIVESRIESVGLFKNGLAVITRTIEILEPGVYVLETVPLAVHGSFWLESDAIVTTTTRARNVEVPLDTGSGSNFREELMGREVTVRLREPGGVEYTGRVVLLEPQPSDEQWSRRYEVPQYGWYGWGWNQNARQPARTGALMLDDGESRHYINLDVIAAVTVHDPQETMTRRQHALELTVEAPAGETGPFTITLTYLAKGITWAPAYLARLDSDGQMTLRQQAAIRNELEDIVDADIYLISGFPNIQFSHVDSLAGPAATIAGFFQQLNQQVGGRPGTGRDVMSQWTVTSNVAALDAGIDFDALAEGESTDIHYQFVGTRSLPAGAAVVLPVAEGETGFERMVEWVIEDDRDEYGRTHYSRTGQHEPSEDSGAWDAVRFRNPFSFPMTTAPMMVVDDARFAGQRTSYWTNPNDWCSVPVTKALSIRTGHSEYEQPDTRVQTTRFGRNGNHVNVRGTFELQNHRGTPVEIVVRRQISGDLVEADESPSVRLRTEGIRSYNPRHELRWTLTLKPGERREVAYSYRVFVAR